MPTIDGILLLLSLTTLLLALTVWRIRQSLSALRPVLPGEGHGSWPMVSIIVPARNEADNIEPCLRSLLAQKYPCFEVLVLNDQSTDDTAERARQLARRDSRLRVLDGQPLPSGWLGKNFALAQAAAEAGGAWLLFTDADTQHQPHALAAAVRDAEEHQDDLLSLTTSQVLGSFWERVVQPVVLGIIALAVPLRRVNDPDHRLVAFANGQFILIRRHVYDVTGGHAAIRGEIVEDCQLARRCKQAGFRVRLADGRHLVRTRMYRSLGELWEGWTKNAFPGAGGRVSIMLAGIGYVTLLGIGPFLAWGGAALLFAGEPQPVRAAVLGAATLHLATLITGWRRVTCSLDIGLLHTLALPLGVLVLDGILLASTFTYLAGGSVTWKGRRYQPADEMRSRLAGTTGRGRKVPGERR